jgi:predicted ester cyclase
MGKAKETVIAEQQAFVDGASDPQRLEDCCAYYTDDVEIRDITEPHLVAGQKDLREFCRGFYNAFPDIHLENTRWTEEGHVVASQFDFVGTHKGEIIGITPTNRAMRLKACAVYECNETDDQIKSEIFYYDSGELRRQLTE